MFAVITVCPIQGETCKYQGNVCIHCQPARSVWQLCLTDFLHFMSFLTFQTDAHVCTWLNLTDSYLFPTHFKPLCVTLGFINYPPRSTQEAFVVKNKKQNKTDDRYQLRLMVMCDVKG